LHVFESDSAEIERHLKFRDYLKSHPSVAKDYEKLKQSLAMDFPNCIHSYCLGKDAWIASIDTRTNWQGLRVVKAVSTREWETVKEFRHRFFFAPNGIDQDPYEWTLDHPSHSHLLLFDPSGIVGYAHIQFWPDHRVALRMIAIDETKQAIGYGSQFLSFCEKWVKEQGVKSMHAEANPTSFYLRNGYVEMPFNDPDGFENPEDIPVGKVL
jgi:GNAT superfamily N-acetyltransferase